MLNVFDRFSRESKICSILYKEQVTRIQQSSLEPNGFLPDGVESPFLYFLGRPTGEKRGRFL